MAKVYRALKLFENSTKGLDAKCITSTSWQLMDKNKSQRKKKTSHFLEEWSLL